MEIEIKEIGDEHREMLKERSRELFHGQYVVSKGVLHEPASLPGFVAFKGDELVGIATFNIIEDDCEIVTLDALARWQGIGTQLVWAVENEARKACCRRLWLITTNDNVDALRFYQKRGFSIFAVHVKALEKSRELKPTIPKIGNYGIALSDEIELEKII